MKNLLFFFIILFCTKIAGQSTNNVINVGSSDGVLISSNIHSFSIGEPISNTITGGKDILSQGFLQPIGKYYLFAHRDTIADYTCKVWPIPANNFVNLSLDFKMKNNATLTTVYAKIITTTGTVLLSQKCLLGTNTFYCKGWASGTYFLELIVSEKKSSIHKILVVH